MVPFKFFRSIFQLRPFRMYRRWRPIVNTFHAGEWLYRRHRRADIQAGVILPSALKFPNQDENTGQSVNRSSLSMPTDALWTPEGRLDGWGVYEFPVSCLRATARCPDTGRQFTFFPRHVPLWNNYSHSEVWCEELPRPMPVMSCQRSL